MLKNHLSKSILLLAILFGTARHSIAQEKYHAKDDLQIVVSGTSTLHDWNMKASKGESNAIVTLNAAGQLSGLTAMQFTVPSEALKSEHSSMDNNAYKALKTEQYKNITYKMKSAKVVGQKDFKFQVITTGSLTI